MPLAMLVLVVAVGLSVLLMATVLRETVSTRTSGSRATALLAARTGLNSALASLRAAQDDEGYGDPAKLPCGPVDTAQVTGSAGDTGSTYRVTIWYLTADPASHDEAWVRANGASCVTSLADRAKYAYVLAAGFSNGGQHRRTLSGTYEFRLRDKGYTPGGQIRVYRTPAATQEYCLTAVPVLGEKLRMERCVLTADGKVVPEQLWAYTELLTIRQVSAPDSVPLCAEALWPQAVEQELTLKPCARDREPRQQWSFDENSNFRGTTDGKTLNSFCWQIRQSDRYIVLNDLAGKLDNKPGRRCAQTLTDYQSWNVTATAGSGAASAKGSEQLVNYFQFGKCFDYTGYRSDGSYSGYLVWAFPCKQSPDPDNVIKSSVWNQMWKMLPEDRAKPGPIYTTDPKGVRLCLRVPGAHGVRKDVVTAENCDPQAVADDPDLYPQLIWRFRGANAPTQDERYRIEGTGPWANRCLAPLAGAAGNAVQADYIGLVACSGDDLQKWNGVPPVNGIGLMSVTEQ